MGLRLGLDDDGSDEFTDHLLLGLGQAGDGMELLFEARGGTALAGDAHSRLTDQQLVEGQVERFGEAREHCRTDADAPDLVEGEPPLGNAELVSERLLYEPALLARGQTVVDAGQSVATTAQQLGMGIYRLYRYPADSHSLCRRREAPAYGL